MLQGNTILELAREKKINNRIKREVVNRIEKHNAITPWVNNAIHQGNFIDGISPSKIMPISQWFSGCLLTDIANDATKMLIDGNSKITACAGNDAYAGTYLPRGSYNTTESAVITGGYRFVWDWATNQGNGTIASICLTRPSIGKTEFRTGSALVDNAPANEQLSLTATTMSQGIWDTYSIVDYENEVGYRVTYASNVITVVERKLNTKVLHLLGSNTSYASQIIHTINQTVANYTRNTRTVAFDYDNHILHLITFVEEGTRLNDYAIDVSNWTCTETVHTYTGAKFSIFAGWDGSADTANGIMVRGGYFYAYSNSNREIVKCNMTNDADIDSFPNPAYTILGGLDYACNGSFILLPNGDWYKLPTIWRGATTNTTAVYCHGGNINNLSICKWVNKDASGDSLFQAWAQTNNYGTLISLARTNYLNVETCFPHVSTCNNLDEAVTKSADLTMKLVYDITETNS